MKDLVTKGMGIAFFHTTLQSTYFRYGAPDAGRWEETST